MQEKMTPLDVIAEYMDLINFQVQQMSTDYTERVPKEGREAEWKRAKEKRDILIDIYKRLDAEQFQPEKQDKEKLYDIIAYTLQHSLAIHINTSGTSRWKVTLLAAPDGGEKRHGIEIEIDGRGWHKRVVSYSFF